MSWGRSCSAWDDSIDIANLEAFDWQEIPDEKLVMTTWHDNVPLSEVIWFAKYAAQHPTVELLATLFVHIGQETTEVEIADSWNDISGASL